MSLHASSYIKTTTAAVSRVRDQLNYTLLAKPQAMTVYIRFVDLGSGSLLSAPTIWRFGNASVTSPGFVLRSLTPGSWLLGLSTDSNSVTVTVPFSPAIGDTLELVSQLAATGSITLLGSLNGAAQVSSSPSAAVVLPPAWGVTEFWLNSTTTSNVGFIGIRNVLIMRGVQDLATCRKYAGL